MTRFVVLILNALLLAYYVYLLTLFYPDLVKSCIFKITVSQTSI